MSILFALIVNVLSLEYYETYATDSNGGIVEYYTNSDIQTPITDDDRAMALAVLSRYCKSNISITFEKSGARYTDTEAMFELMSSTIRLEPTDKSLIIKEVMFAAIMSDSMSCNIDRRSTIDWMLNRPQPPIKWIIFKKVSIESKRFYAITVHDVNNIVDGDSVVWDGDAKAITKETIRLKISSSDGLIMRLRKVTIIF